MIGKAIEVKRKEFGVSRESLCKAMGIDRNQYSKRLGSDHGFYEREIILACQYLRLKVVCIDEALLDYCIPADKVGKVKRETFLTRNKKVTPAKTVSWPFPATEENTEDDHGA